MISANLLLQARGAIPSTPSELILTSGLMTQTVLGFLALLSLISWTVMFVVWRQIANANANYTLHARDGDHLEMNQLPGGLLKLQRCK